jgi:hypothetical protein
MEIIVYFHATRDMMAEIGEKAGLHGQALDRFSYALSQVRCVLDVDPGTGEDTLIKVETGGAHGERVELWARQYHPADLRPGQDCDQHKC